MTEARRPLRIAYVVGEFPSVSETFVLNQITGLMERGHHVDVWADRPGTIDRRNRGSGIATCYAVGAWPRLLVGILLRPRRLLKLALAARYGRPGLMALRYATAEKRHYDVIHAHFGTNGLKAAALRDIGVLSGPLVTTFHAVDLTRFVRRFGRDMYSALFRGGALFLPIGEYARRKLAALGCPKERVVVHRMGVDTCEFAPAAERRSADEGLNILTVGRLVEKKGVSYGIRAVAEVARRGRKVNYNIVGDGPLRAELQELADAISGQGTIRFMGLKHPDEVRSLLGQADVLLAPSVTAADGDEEGIPVVIMEAMSCGVPVVSTLHAGIPELVSESETGFLVPERDSDALADRLFSLAADPDLRTRMGAAGRRRIIDHYEIGTLNDVLEALLSAAADIS